MARLNASNNAESVLTESVNDSNTSITVEDASVFPVAPFRISVNDEIMEVTEVSGNTMTVVRGLEDTNESSHASGSKVENRLTAGTYEELVSTDELDGVEQKVDAHMADYVQFRNDIEQEISGARIDLINSVNNLVEM